MPTHVTGTREDRLKTRFALLHAEKDLTRRSDDVARQRQALPWVPIDKAYRFETDGRHHLACRPLPAALSASRPSRHVRPRLQDLLPVLFGDR